MTDTDIDSGELVKFLCIDKDADTGELKIECNFCSLGDYMFFNEKKEELLKQDWLANAVHHIQEHHPNGAPPI